MNRAIDEIKSKLDIVDFIGSYIQLKRAGKSYKAICPFHQEHTPSFVVSPERQIWHCFGSCNEGGDVIQFLMKWENISFIEALKELAHRTGVQLDTGSIDDSTWTKKEKLYQINLAAMQFFHYVLKENYHGTQAREYLHDRVVSDQMVDVFQIGMAPNSWDSLVRYLRKKHYTDQEMIDSGLVIQGKKGGVYDRFRNRLIFPINDPRGNCIGCAGRLLSQEDKSFGGKYINTPETMIYRKRESLYGIHRTKDYIKKENNAILVEGEFDVISPYQRGIRNIVAIKGSAVTKEQLQVLKRYTNRISLALDADAAGQEAVLRGIQEAEKMDMEVTVIVLEGGKDPDEIAKTDLGGLKQHIKHAPSLYDYLITTAVSRHGTKTAYNKKKITDDVLPHLNRIYNPIIKAHYTKYLAETLEISEDSIQDMMQKERRKRSYTSYKSSSSTKQTAAPSSEPAKQTFLLSFLLQSSHISAACDNARSILSAENFSVPSYGKVYAALLEYVERDRPDAIVINDFVATLPDELHPVVDKLYIRNIDLPSQDVSHTDTDLYLKEITKASLRAKKEAIERIDKSELSIEEQSNLIKEKGRIDTQLKSL